MLDLPSIQRLSIIRFDDRVVIRQKAFDPRILFDADNHESLSESNDPRSCVGLRTSGCNLVPTGVCGVLGDATPVRNLLSRGPGYDEGGVRNRETGSVGWLRWNTGRVSSKETTCRVEGG